MPSQLLQPIKLCAVIYSQKGDVSWQAVLDLSSHRAKEKIFFDFVAFALVFACCE